MPLLSNLDLQIISWFKTNMFSLFRDPFYFFKLIFISYILVIFYINTKYNMKGVRK